MTVIPILVIVIGYTILVSEINCLDELCELGISHYVKECGSAFIILGEDEGAKSMWRYKAFKCLAYEATREKIVVVTAVRDLIKN